MNLIQEISGVHSAIQGQQAAAGTTIIEICSGGTERHPEHTGLYADLPALPAEEEHQDPKAHYPVLQGEEIPGYQRQNHCRGLVSYTILN